MGWHFDYCEPTNRFLLSYLLSLILSVMVGTIMFSSYFTSAYIPHSLCFVLRWLDFCSPHSFWSRSNGFETYSCSNVNLSWCCWLWLQSLEVRSVLCLPGVIMSQSLSSCFTCACAMLYMYHYTHIPRQPVFSCFCQFSNSLKSPECNTEDNPI